MDDKVLFGQKLLELRKKSGKSQTDIAKVLGITQPAYQNYENGRREAGYATITKLADFYGVTTDYLLGREPPSDPLATLNIDTGSKSVMEMFAELPEGTRKIILDSMIRLADAAKGTQDNEEVSYTTETVYENAGENEESRLA